MPKKCLKMYSIDKDLKYQHVSLVKRDTFNIYSVLTPRISVALVYLIAIYSSHALTAAHCVVTMEAAKKGGFKAYGYTVLLNW